MKHFFSVLFFSLFCSSSLSGHGFHADTYVVLAGDSLQAIDMVCKRVLRKPVHVASCDMAKCIQSDQKVGQSGKTQTLCMVRISFDASYQDIFCTPTQEFYLIDTGQWRSAYALRNGMRLLCKNGNGAVVQSVTLVRQKSDVYTIQVEKTHTFYVGAQKLLTHNMLLPIAFSLSASVPFGTVAAGTIGTFFGPIAVAATAVIGGVAYALVKVFNDDVVPSYHAELAHPSYYENKLQEYSAYNACAPALPQQALPVYATPTSCEPAKKEETILASVPKEQSASIAIAVSCPANCRPKQPIHAALNANKKKNRVARKPFNDNNQKEQKAKKNPNGISTGITYHHKNSRGRKGASPTNDQRALDNSIKIKNNSSGRVSVDGEEIIVFRQSAPGKFHGHVREWEQLEQEGKMGHRIMRRLREEGLVNSKGKILK